MPLNEIKCLNDLYQVIESKQNEIIPVKEIWTLFHKYDTYHKCADHQNRNVIEIRDRNRKDHKILYFILEKLYMAKSTDLNLVSNVIKRIHIEQIAFNNLISDLFTESKNFNTDEIIQMLEYCLKYAYMQKILFDGFRMAHFDYFFPVSMLPDKQFTSSLPTVMGILLRYGMLLDPTTGQGPILGDIFDEDIFARERFDTHIVLWCSIINKGILSCNPHFLPVNALPRKKKKVFNLSLEIAKLLIRDSVKIRLSVFKVSMTMLYTFVKYGDDGYDWSYDSDNDLEEDFGDITEYNRSDDLDTKELVNPKCYPTNALNLIHKLGRFIPGLPKRCLEPTSLKHFCKQIIRKVLHLNWQLPNGIFNLSLPTPLVRYLNLEID